MTNATKGLVCRACESTHLVCIDTCAEFAANLFSDFKPGRLYRCTDCALGQRHPIPPLQVLQSQYESAEATAMDYQYESNAAWSHARASLMAATPSGKAISILDVGCHTGAFLGGLPTEWRRHGIESGVAPSRIARELHGVEIIGPRIEAVGTQWGSRFDIVTMFDVVEHLANPADGLVRAAQLLRPGGILMFSSGDMDAWTWSWLRGNHWYLQTPQHVSFISVPFITKLVQRNQLSLSRVLRIPHQRNGLLPRCAEAMELAHWASRQTRGCKRIPYRLIQSLPGFRRLRHRQSVPWTVSLRDHLLVTISR